MPKEILLTTGQITLVDDEDYEMLVDFSRYWRLNGRYVMCVKNREVVRMHRLLINPKDNEIVDHRNNNPLDNQKHNLRIADNSGNTRNAKKTSKKTTSKYKGVSFNKPSKSWKVGIFSKESGKEHLGYYSNEIAGALAYNKRAKELFGEFAYLNDVGGIEIEPEDYLIKRKPMSKYKGVTFNKSKNKWEAQVYQDKKVKKLGTANSEEEAYKILVDYVCQYEELRKRYLDK